MDGAERKCLAYLIPCTSSLARRSSMPPMLLRRTLVQSCSSVLRPSMSKQEKRTLPTSHTALPPSTQPTADFSLSPADLSDSPTVASVLVDRGFSRRNNPGAWLSPDGIAIDLMVPEALAGAGSRSADLGPHGNRVARRAKGLEGALVDRERTELASLDPADDRSVTMYVAGPGALLVAKTHKIADRAESPSRIEDKDALDVLRLLRATDTEDLARRITLLARHELSSAVTRDAVAHLPVQFGRSDAVGIGMAVRAAGLNAEVDVIAASMTALVSDLLAMIRELEVDTPRRVDGPPLD